MALLVVVAVMNVVVFVLQGRAATSAMEFSTARSNMSATP